MADIYEILSAKALFKECFDAAVGVENSGSKLRDIEESLEEELLEKFRAALAEDADKEFEPTESKLTCKHCIAYLLFFNTSRQQEPCLTH